MDILRLRVMYQEALGRLRDAETLTDAMGLNERLDSPGGNGVRSDSRSRGGFQRSEQSPSCCRVRPRGQGQTKGSGLVLKGQTKGSGLDQGVRSCIDVFA